MVRREGLRGLSIEESREQSTGAGGVRNVGDHSK